MVQGLWKKARIGGVKIERIMSDYITKQDLREFEDKIREQHEIRIQMISAHYSDVLKSNQELKERVCGANKEINHKIDALIEQIQPVLDAQKLVTTIHAFFKWLGLPFTAIGFFIWWIWSKV